MSDDAIRAAERTYRSSGNPADGEAYVQAVLRSTGLNSTFLIARVIETQRVVQALLNPMEFYTIRSAQDRPVTPDDMVSFLRGGREWLEISPEDRARSEAIDREAEQVERLAIHPAQADPNAHLPHQRGVPAGDAILCNHANENPGHCPCEADCYCRQDGHTCSDVSSEPNPFDRQCDYCANEATWRFRYTTVVPSGHVNGRRVEVVCGAHLAQARQEHNAFNYDFMNRRAAEQRVEMLRDSHRHMDSLDEMARHHEAVDDV